MFERVRLLATAEERHRIARDMHDGVAQEVVALGYVVDEIAALSSEAEVHDLAAGLRTELTRVVSELRYSIFDLRHEVGGANLSSALGDYLRRIVEDGHFQAHLVLDVSGDPLSPRVETHLLRIAQEAIGNVRKHAGASHVWVTLRSDGASVLLQVEDDGVGKAAPKERHWGLQSMRERAEAVGGSLSIHDRDGGGTVVRLERAAPTVPHHTAPEGSHHGHHSPAGR
jgi:signal transduction histidine kinase